MKSARSRLRSPVQKDVYDLLVCGLSNEEIARELGIIVRTVKYHVTAVLRAVGASRRGEVIAAHGRATTSGRVTGLRSRVTSERQRQVYDLMVEGATYKEIAGKVGISERTVKFHAQRLLDELDVPTQAKLVAAHWGAEDRPASSNLNEAAKSLRSAIEEAKVRQRRIDLIIHQLERAVRALS